MLEPESTRLSGSIESASSEDLVVDVITMARVNAQEITWQDRKPEKIKGEACSFYNNSLSLEHAL